MQPSSKSAKMAVESLSLASKECSETGEVMEPFSPTFSSDKDDVARHQISSCVLGKVERALQFLLGPNLMNLNTPLFCCLNRAKSGSFSGPFKESGFSFDPFSKSKGKKIVSTVEIDSFGCSGLDLLAGSSNMGDIRISRPNFKVHCTGSLGDSPNKSSRVNVSTFSDRNESRNGCGLFVYSRKNFLAPRNKVGWQPVFDREDLLEGSNDFHSHSESCLELNGFENADLSAAKSVETKDNTLENFMELGKFLGVSTAGCEKTIHNILELIEQRDNRGVGISLRSHDSCVPSRLRRELKNLEWSLDDKRENLKVKFGGKGSRGRKPATVMF